MNRKRTAQAARVGRGVALANVAGATSLRALAAVVEYMFRVDTEMLSPESFGEQMLMKQYGKSLA